MKSQEFVFVFKYEEVFTETEMLKSNLEDLKILKKLVAESVNKRLRIKEIEEQTTMGVSHEPGYAWSGNVGLGDQQAHSFGQPHISARRYFAFFVCEEPQPVSV